MDYIELELHLSDAAHLDVFEAELAALDFESFLTEGNTLKAYIKDQEFDEESVKEVLHAYDELLYSYEKRKIPHANWNALWESSYEAVLIEDVEVRAPFHPASEHVRRSIVIDPNMSFGTGHHPTTHMVLEAMQEMDLSGKKLCDFGCGSGVLAIYASLEGASGIAIEIDPHAAEAARGNLELNGVQQFEVITGDLSAFVGDGFDLILANINRNVIEESLRHFIERLTPQGRLICAGFLDGDADDLSERLERHSMRVYDRRSMDGWTMLASEKIP